MSDLPICHQIHVGAIPFGATEETLRGLFAPFGPIRSIRVRANWEHPSEEPYARIELEKGAEAVAAMDGKKIGNTYLRVHPRGLHD